MPLDIPTLYDRFFQERRYLKNITAKTVLFYGQSWAAWRPFLENVKTEQELAAAVKNGTMAMMKEGRLSPTSINDYGRTIHAFLNWLHQEGCVSARYHVSKLKCEQKVIPVFPTEAVERIVRYHPEGEVEARTHALCCFILDNGARIDEATSLRVEDINFGDMLITINKGKGRKQRVVPMTQEFRKILYKYVQNLASGYVFHTTQHSKLDYNNALRDLKGLFRRLKLVVPQSSWHVFRHTFATSYIRNGGDVTRLQRILGHSELLTTMRYIHLQTEDLQVVHDQYSALARGIRKAN
jgi:integrase/recombinase XerD